MIFSPLRLWQRIWNCMSCTDASQPSNPKRLHIEFRLRIFNLSCQPNFRITPDIRPQIPEAVSVLDTRPGFDQDNNSICFLVVIQRRDSGSRYLERRKYVTVRRELEVKLGGLWQRPRPPRWIGFPSNRVSLFRVEVETLRNVGTRILSFNQSSPATSSSRKVAVEGESMKAKRMNVINIKHGIGTLTPQNAASAMLTLCSAYTLQHLTITATASRPRNPRT
jgi:hypothetical protein